MGGKGNHLDVSASSCLDEAMQTSPLLMSVALGLCGSSVAVAQDGAQKIALDPSGQPVFEFSEALDLSDDGRFVAFICFDGTLAPGEANNKEDVFVRDMLLGTTQRVVPFAEEGVFQPAISGDGRYVVVSTSSENLVGTQTNGYTQVYRYDLQTGLTTLISLGVGTEGGDGQSGGPSISDDGQFVSFYSYAPDLILGDSNQTADVFLRDANSNYMELISIGPNGQQADQHCYLSAMTPDARYVVFETRSNTIEVQPNNYRDLFLRDRVLGTTEKLTFDYNGNSTDGRSEGPIEISDDGRFVSFTSEADDLVVGQNDDLFPLRAVFVHDRLLGMTEIISVDPTMPGQPELGDCFGASMTADGRYVVFSCAESGAVYLRDRQLGSLFRVDQNALGQNGNDEGFEAVISDNGEWLGFTSYASNLVSNDVNANRDGYMRPWKRAGELALTPPAGGSSVTLTLTDLQPSTFVLLGASLQGPGPTPFDLVGISGLANLGNLTILMTGFADAAGQWSLTTQLGPGMSGLPLYVQALDLFTGQLTPAYNGLIQ